MAHSTWHRRLDLVYLTFFIIHLPIMFGKCSSIKPNPSHRRLIPPLPSTHASIISRSLLSTEPLPFPFYNRSASLHLHILTSA